MKKYFVLLSLVIFTVVFQPSLSAETVSENQEFKLGTLADVEKEKYSSITTDEDYIKEVFKENDTKNLSCQADLEAEYIIGQGVGIYGEDYYLGQTCLTDGTTVYFTDDEERFNFEYNMVNGVDEYTPLTVSYLDDSLNKVTSDVLSVDTIDSNIASDETPSAGRYWHGEYVEYDCPANNDLYTSSFMEGKLVYGCYKVNDKLYAVPMLKTDSYANYKRKAMIWEGETCGTGVGVVHDSAISSKEHIVLDEHYNPYLGCKDHRIQVY